DGLAITQKLAAADPDSARAQRDLAISFERLGTVHKQLFEFREAVTWFDRELELVKQWPNPEALRLNPKFVEGEVSFCRSAENAIDDMEFVFRQSAEKIPELLDVRVRALLQHGRPSEASATA